MKKEEAQNRLISIEKEIKELRKIIDAPETKKEITERVKTFEDACDILGINPDEAISKSDTKDEIAYKKLKIITTALRGDWIPDWDNSSEYKWYPYFKMSGFGFSATNYEAWHTHTCVGSRLCFPTEKLAQYAGKQFENIYKDFLTI